MSTEMIPEVIADEFVDTNVEVIRQQSREQAKLSQAVRVYLEAVERFESAHKDFTESCKDVRDVIKPNTTIVVSGGYGRHYGKHYLLKSDDQGNFTVEPIEVI